MGDILVDGYNVIKNNEMFKAMELKNFSSARVILIKQLHNKYRDTFHQVIVVFDGDGAYEQVSHEDHIRIIYSRHDETADNVIMRLAAEARQDGRDVVMYSDDEEVRQAVAEHGGNPLSTHTLTTKLNAAPRDIAIRSAYRQEARRVYGLDPSHKAEDEEAPSRPQHSKKKKKRRRR
ncbi:MAG: ribosome-dependent mRNA decay endonuclease Rae1/YacP [Ktedonobacteraceae bacterium]